MTAAALPGTAGSRQSPFAGTDVCREAGLALPGGRHGLYSTTTCGASPRLSAWPTRWPRSTAGSTSLRSADPRLAAGRQGVDDGRMLAPARGGGHAAARLPDPAAPDDRVRPARRADRLLNWLAGHGVASLADVDEDHCEAYLAHRRYLLDQNGHVAGERSPATRRAAARPSWS